MLLLNTNKSFTSASHLSLSHSLPPLPSLKDSKMCHWEDIDQQTWRSSDYVIKQVTENYNKTPGNSQLKADKEQESKKVILVPMGILDNMCMRCDRLSSFLHRH